MRLTWSCACGRKQRTLHECTMCARVRKDRKPHADRCGTHTPFFWRALRYPRQRGVAASLPTQSKRLLLERNLTTDQIHVFSARYCIDSLQSCTCHGIRPGWTWWARECMLPHAAVSLWRGGRGPEGCSRGAQSDLGDMLGLPRKAARARGVCSCRGRQHGSHAGAQECCVYV